MATYKITNLNEPELSELIVAPTLEQAEKIFSDAHPELNPLQIEIESIFDTAQVLTGEVGR